uniref:Nucleotide-diphospho-sugar transferase domain-containing protein n=1 Tax=Haptolina brevifila TaxID=156173 RepID=A0A7S2G147_9EUKA
MATVASVAAHKDGEVDARDPTPGAAADASAASSSSSTASSIASSIATSAASIATSVQATVGAASSSVITSAARRYGGGKAMSSAEAVQKVLDEAGLKAGMSDVEGLGEVTTAEAFHEALAPGEAVWLTFSNQAYMHFAQNWYMSVRRIGRHRQVVVAALDPQTLHTWRSLRVPVLDYTQFGDSSDFRGIGSDQARFRRMGAMKVAAFHQLLKLGRTVLVSDVDTVWLADPQPYLTSLSEREIDLGVTSDCLSREADENKRGDNKRFHPHGVWFCGHNPGNHFGATFNTGVLYMRPTEAAKKFTSEWNHLLLQPTDDWHMEDQRGFNQLVMTNFYPTVAAPGISDGSVVLAANRTLRLMPLPSRRFCSGHTFFVQQSGRNDACLNVHVTFTEGGVHGKLWRLQEAGLWELHPKGYWDTGRYLTITPPAIPTPLPPARIEPLADCRARLAAGAAPDPRYHGWWSPKDAETAPCKAETPQYDDRNKDHGVTITEAHAMSPRLQAHLKMADRYLVALRDGMILAYLLNRTFVFPQFGCLCDRSEWPDIMPTCRLENSDLEFPFGCPLNFLLNVHFMQGLEEDNGGRHGVPYRPHSFLRSEKLAPPIRDSTLNLTFVRSPLDVVEPQGTVSLPRGATDAEVIRKLGPSSRHDSTAIIYVRDSEDVLGGFEDEEEGEYIMNLLYSKALYGSWCCSRTNFHHPGATAFFNSPPRLPIGRDATSRREARKW